MKTPIAQRSKTAVITAVAALACVTLGLTGCASGSSNDSSDSKKSSEAGTWPRTIKTEDGDVKLDKQPKKIVSTSTTLTGTLLSIDAPVIASGATAPNSAGLSDDVGFFNQWSKIAKKKGVKKLWDNASPDPEKVIEYDPDLIIVSKNAGDSVTEGLDKLKQIAPVIVLDYGKQSWQSVTKTLGKATGHEKQATDVVAKFDKNVADAKKEMKLPEGTTSSFIPFGDGSGVAALTPESPQNELLTSLGFKLATIPDSVKGDTSMGASRKDIVSLSNENVQKGLPGDTWIVVGPMESDKKTIEESAVYNTAPAVKNKKVYYMAPETFRFDYYSATIMLNDLKKDFAK